MKKYCTKCGKQFESVGREVICPECKQAAAEEAKKNAVLRAKTASWTGESVPVRISGRASTVIRRYGAANDLPFAQALDALLKATPFFQGMQMAWEDIEPYKSRRRKSTTEDEQEVKTASKPQDKPQEVTKVAKTSVKTTARKPASKAASTSKAAGKKEGKKA